MSTNFSHTARVIRADQVTPLIKHFSFERVDGKPFSPFSAGSHVVIGMNNGTNTHKNPYSLVGSSNVFWPVCKRGTDCMDCRFQFRNLIQYYYA